MSKDSWLDWYQDGRVEENVLLFADTLTENNASRVLDFGCGTGRHTVYLAKMGFDVHGFDWSEIAVARARLELSQQKLSANLRVWDMNEAPLPYDDSFFDGVLVVRVFHHTFIGKIRSIAAEIERITREGGYIYVEVPAWSKGEKVQNPNAIEVEPGTLIWSEGEEANIPHHHFRKDELLELFQRCSPLGLEEKNEHYCLTLIRN